MPPNLVVRPRQRHRHWGHGLETEAHPRYWPESLHVVDEVVGAAAMVVVDVDDAVAEGEEPLLRRLVSHVRHDLPHEIRPHAKPADVAARLDEPLVVDGPGPAHDDGGIDPVFLEARVDVSAAEGAIDVHVEVDVDLV